MESNPRLELAYKFVQYTDRNIFLTGKAGTGKTTFLHNLKANSLKRMAVVAPTGVAAINAGGVTINSFFQLPFGPYIPGQKSKSSHKRFNREKIVLLKSLDLLVIDEISMVRADTLDHIDEVLRRYRHPHKPFGGTQLLMIGDLHQLSPVVKDDDWLLLKDFYPNLYFFSSRALLQSSPVSIELQKIYRQQDDHFISLLNSVRKNEITKDVLKSLNERYLPKFEPGETDGYITLTTHNESARQINDVKLNSLTNIKKIFKAEVLLDFPEYAFPTLAELELKEGAQVMFVKNDPSRERLFYNGKIGTITRFEEELIYVKCESDPSEIAVSKIEWSNIKYELNAETKEVEEKVIGRFIQYPLKLAWAITIHKSQGLTFEKAIIDANLAFAHGQVYVALSRCKTLEGMVLRTPISFNSVKTDGTVAEYTRNASSNEPDEKVLLNSRMAYQSSQILELFDFSTLKVHLFHFQKLVQDHFNILDPDLNSQIESEKTKSEKEIHQVAETFRKQILNLVNPEILPEEDSTIQERIKKASHYFKAKLTTLQSSIDSFPFDNDNKAVSESAQERIQEFTNDLNLKMELLNLSAIHFNSLEYIKIKANFEASKEKLNTNVEQEKVQVPASIEHPELYKLIKEWRNQLADEKSVPVYHILAQKSLQEIVNLLPGSLKDLGNIKGIGKIKIAQFGDHILRMVNDYKMRQGLESTPSIPDVKKNISNTQLLSFEQFKIGKSIPEIAVDRNLAIGTIEGHLLPFIKKGELSVFDLITEDITEKIMEHLENNSDLPLSQTKEVLGESVSYFAIRAVKSYMEYRKSS